MKTIELSLVAIVLLMLPTVVAVSSVEQSSSQAQRADPFPSVDVDPTERQLEASIPALAGRSRAEKIRTLRWWLTVPGYKTISLFPDLRQDRSRSPGERHRIAQGRIASALEQLSVPEEASHEPRL